MTIWMQHAKPRSLLHLSFLHQVLLKISSKRYSVDQFTKIFSMPYAMLQCFCHQNYSSGRSHSLIWQKISTPISTTRFVRMIWKLYAAIKLQPFVFLQSNDSRLTFSRLSAIRQLCSTWPNKDAALQIQISMSRLWLLTLTLHFTKTARPVSALQFLLISWTRFSTFLSTAFL